MKGRWRTECVGTSRYSSNSLSQSCGLTARQVRAVPALLHKRHCSSLLNVFGIAALTSFHTLRPSTQPNRARLEAPRVPIFPSPYLERQLIPYASKPLLVHKPRFPDWLHSLRANLSSTTRPPACKPRPPTLFHTRVRKEYACPVRPIVYLMPCSPAPEHRA